MSWYKKRDGSRFEPRKKRSKTPVTLYFRKRSIDLSKMNLKYHKDLVNLEKSLSEYFGAGKLPAPIRRALRKADGSAFDVELELSKVFRVKISTEGVYK